MTISETRSTDPQLPFFEVYRTMQGTLENVVLLADYEALQANCDALLEVLEEMIDVAKRVDSWESFPSDPIERAEDAIRAYLKQGE